MGMDLLTYGFTTRSPKHYSDEAVKAILAALTDEWIEENFDDLDPSGGTESVEEARTLLDRGFEEYSAILKGDHRMAADYFVPGTELFFTITGGGSWGDGPYDNWYDLGIFLNACHLLPALAEAAMLVCWGLPDAATMAKYPKEA
jgi:hypothetical protein